jgi:GTP-binding protein LepA
MESIAEPFARIKIFTPKEFANQILLLCKKHRGEYENIEIYDDKINLIIFLIPLSEIIYDFYDKMKSISKGYATFDYEHIGYRKNKLVKVDILINKKKIDILSIITNFENAVRKSREMCENLKNLISRHQFEIVIQAAINNKIIARETIKPYRKDVTKKLYGGDYTRKQKLLEKQKEGKKRMKKFGNIEIPSSVFRNLKKIINN